MVEENDDIVVVQDGMDAGVESLSPDTLTEEAGPADVEEEDDDELDEEEEENDLDCAPATNGDDDEENFSS